MKVVSEETLALFRGPGRCECCNLMCQRREPHHILPKGMGGGGRMDVRENLLAVGASLPFPECPCHQRIHAGNIGRATVFGIVAQREDTTPEKIAEYLYLLRRLPTGTSLPKLRNHHCWKGNAACQTTKRERAQVRYKIDRCERCGGKALDRHHIDGNTGNNRRDNLMFLCRRCHMTVDGRNKQPRPCIICKQPSKPLRKGRCHRCNEYLRRNGTEWSAEAVAPLSERSCIICDCLTKQPSRGRCHRCYEYLRTTGRDRF